MKNFLPFYKKQSPGILTNFFVLCALLGGLTTMANPSGDTVRNYSASPIFHTYKPFAVTITQQPAAAIVCEGSNAGFTIAATGSAALSYQWQLSINGGSTWSNLTNVAPYSGVTTAALTITNVPASLTTYRYRCIVSDGSPATSASALLTVNPAPQVQSGNIAVQVCISGSVSITAAAYAGLSYQWQVNTGSGFSNVVNNTIYTGAGTNMLGMANVPGSMEGYIYRYVATNTISGCTAISGLDTLHVLAYATITQQPVAATVCPGGDTSFTVAATGAASIKWQLSTNGSTWSDIINNSTYAGASTSTLTVHGATVSMNTYRYRAVVSNVLSCAVATNIVFLFVRANTAITVQPANTLVCATNTATFSVTATGSTLTYQWQCDNGTNGGTWTNVATGGTTATLVRSGVTMSMNGYRYRVMVNGYCGSVLSAEATLQTKAGTWIGVTSTDWHTASNWCGGVPDGNTDVLIPAGTPFMPDIISGIGYSRSITIDAGTQLTISGGTTAMTGPFSIQGGVAYTGFADQLVLPATHGSLTVDGSGNKYLQAATDVIQNLTLNGAAKLVTNNYLLTMKAGSNPISGINLSYTSTSWIVTGTGNAGAANTGLGGLKVEDIKANDGNVLFPVGPTSTTYNPAQLANQGVRDNFTIAVNDQQIPGALAGQTIYRTWNVIEGTPGGSRVSLDLKWNKPEEQPLFDSANVWMIRSAGGAIVQNSPVLRLAGRPLARASMNEFLTQTQFSLQTYRAGDAILLPVKLRAFGAEKISAAEASISWTVEGTSAPVVYTVQKSSVPDRSFMDIANVNGDKAKESYSITDNKLESGTTYYRLKAVDQNGETSYSQVAKLVNLNSAASFQLRPSATSASATQLFMKLKRKGLVEITLSNSVGQLQWKRSVEQEAGEHLLPLDMSHISKGFYFIRINGTSIEPTLLPFIKQ